MKKIASIFMLLIIGLLAACSPTQSDAIKSMASSEEGAYSIYVFWDGEQTDLQTMLGEALTVISSDKVMNSLKISNISIVSLSDESQPYPYKKLFDIEESPTLLLLDTEKVLLQTTNVEDLYDFSDNAAK
ncbi:hypothetical protein ACX93W_19875 [Paenibacillus sp. CAU 1782]